MVAKAKVLQIYIVSLIVFVVVAYFSFSKSIPVSYFAEMLWVKRSSFFDFFIRGDFYNNSWYLYES